MRFVIVGLITLYLAVPGATIAQELSGSGLSSVEEPFVVSMSPQFPQPYGQAILSFFADTLDLANARLTVTSDGKSVYEGAVRSVAVPLGRAGLETVVVARVVSSGTTASKTIRIRPQDVTLIAEPVASSPPLYPGKPLVPIDGDVRVVAVANLRYSDGRQVPPSSVSYLWTIDGTRISNSSGPGKSSILVASPLQYRVRDVSVVATSPDGTLSGEDSLTLAASNPSLRVYENDPLLGVRYDRALSGEYSMLGTESTLFASPFSFPTTGGAPLVRWFLNGELAQTGPLITLRPTGSGQGSASLSVTASSGDFSVATLSLPLVFGEERGPNFFGL